jgi:hypothetical protein
VIAGDREVGGERVGGAAATQRYIPASHLERRGSPQEKGHPAETLVPDARTSFRIRRIPRPPPWKLAFTIIKQKHSRWWEVRDRGDELLWLTPILCWAAAGTYTPRKSYIRPRPAGAPDSARPMTTRVTISNNS